MQDNLTRYNASSGIQNGKSVLEQDIDEMLSELENDSDLDY